MENINNITFNSMKIFKWFGVNLSYRIYDQGYRLIIYSGNINTTNVMINHLKTNYNINVKGSVASIYHSIILYKTGVAYVQWFYNEGENHTSITNKDEDFDKKLFEIISPFITEEDYSLNRILRILKES